MILTTENEKRAEYGRRALDHYQQFAGDPNDFEASMIDLVTDLLHVAELQTGTGPEELCRIALSHWRAEVI